MNNVKTYDRVHAAKEFSNFGISRMEDIYARRQGAVDEPHRHQYYTILLIKHAKGVHKIDFNSYDLSPNQIYFVSPGHVHQLIESEQSFGYSITFSTEFLIQNSISTSFIDSLNLFQNYGQSPPLLPNPYHFATIEKYATEIFALYHGDANMKDFSIGAFLKLLLIECNNVCGLNPIPDEKDLASHKIIRNFKDLVDLRYNEQHTTSFYASELNITADHLNRIIKANLGTTAKEYIQAKIITEAKRLLYFSELSNKEIGYELGFNEPANFSAFFKKCTKSSPSAFIKNEISA